MRMGRVSQRKDGGRAERELWGARAGYAADGYARAQGIGCVVVTFTVGGLSVINAIAGAMSEHLPVVCITGCPNSNDFGGDKILHHTIGEVDFTQELRCAPVYIRLSNPNQTLTQQNNPN